MNGMDRRVPVALAVEGAARLLERGWGASLKTEERLRRAIAACALELSEVLQVQIRPEWQPPMQLFPSRPTNPLGGFDLAFRMRGDGGVTVAAETKWSTGTKVNALDETPWDVLKLVHARTVPKVRWALLVTAAPDAAWEVAQFAAMFDEDMMPISKLLALNPHMYEEDSKSRPLKLPPYVQSSPTVRVPFVLNGKSWQIRVASVRANGEPWLDCDEDGWPIGGDQPAMFDWPHPEPGLGMVNDDSALGSVAGELPARIASADLVPTDVPGPQASWFEIIQFASRHDGYATGVEALESFANSSVQHFDVNGAIDPQFSLDELRSCLFFESRRYHHFGHTPGYQGTRYIRALMAAIRGRLVAR
jgi:hypothetical protein